MNEKTITAPPATNPIADFLKKLPNEATILGFRLRRSSEKSEFVMAYSFNGSTVQTSITTKGGTV